MAAAARAAFLKSQELNEIAQRRTLMLLSVLSGEKPVTDAIAEAQISRPHYYQLEERGLQALLVAMEPGAGPGRPAETSVRLLQMEERVKELESDKRRLERLLHMTRKVLRSGPMKTPTGRPRSVNGGRSASRRSREATKERPASASPISSSDPSIR